MKRKKYNLSEEGFNRLMKGLEQIAYEKFSKSAEEIDGLLEAPITTDFIKLITKVKGLDDVIERNDHLTKYYRGYLDMYGFETMYDMYIYAMSCDLVPEELRKERDYSKLVPVKRTIIRNGKEHEVTVYINPNKDENGEENEDKEVKAPKGQTKAPKRRHARELKSDIVGGERATNPRDVAKLKEASKQMPRGDKPFQDGSKYYLAIRGDDGEIVGVVGYSEEGQYLTMDFYRSNGQVSGVATKGFFELIRLAVEKNKGVKMEDRPEARSVFAQSGLEQHENGYWYIEAEELQELFRWESGTQNE